MFVRLSASLSQSNPNRIYIYLTAETQKDIMKSMTTARDREDFCFSSQRRSINEKGFLSKVPTSEYLSPCEGHCGRKGGNNRAVHRVADRTRADKKERRYQASLTEMILRVESLLTQAYQTFRWTWASECPTDDRREGGERLQERVRER